MSTSPKVPPDKSPFWRFSVKFYAEPGVAPACIRLQDEASVDVNVLLFLLWNAAQNRTLNEAAVEEVEHAVGPWRDMAVIPLREVRRALKSPPPVMAADVAEGFRTRIKAVELEAERLQQEALYAMAGRVGQPCDPPLQAARDSIAAYERQLRPFPAEALEAILTAFANVHAAFRDTSINWDQRDQS